MATRLNLFEMTYDQLYAATVSAFPDTDKRQHIANQVQVKQIQYSPAPGSNSLAVRSNTSGSDGETHDQSIIAKGVTFNPKGTEIPGSDARMVPISSLIDDIQVRCSCSDFYWRMATWNSASDALVGDPPPPYTKRSNRPPVNPSKSPGVCKHIIAVIDRARNDGLFE